MAHQATTADNRLLTRQQAQAAATSAYSTQADDRLITDKEVAHLLGASRSWPWKLSQAGRFPSPVKLSPRCTRWRLSQVREWMADPQGWQAAMVEG